MFEACCHWNHGKCLHPLHRDWDVDSPSICANVHLPILDHSACCFDTLCSVCEYGWRSGELGGVHFFPQPCHGHAIFRLPSVRLQTSCLKPYAKVPPPPGDQPAWVLSLALFWEPELRMVWGVSSPGSESAVAEHQGFMLRLSWLA